MSKCCNSDPHNCAPTCDFCRMFNFNPKTINGQEGIYVYEGYCVLHEERRDPESECDDFICSNYKVKDPARL